MEILKRSHRRADHADDHAGRQPVDADASTPARSRTRILNLAINARDAMPNGGELDHRDAQRRGRRICHSTAAGGEFVLLSVSDTGEGMPPEVLERAFEPFFSTKEPGRGTGLGLSTVYGFAEQSGGHATIASEVGNGHDRQPLPAARRGRRGGERRDAAEPFRCRRTTRSCSSSRTTPRFAS